MKALKVFAFIALAVVITLAIIPLSAKTKVNKNLGPGEVLKLTEFTGQNITKLEIRHAFSVELVEGNTTGVEIEIDSRAQPFLVCELKNGKLRLGFENLPRELQNSSTLKTRPKAVVTISKLESIDLAGASSLDAARSNFTTSNLPIHTSGASRLHNLRIQDNGTVLVSCVGASKIDNLKIDGSQTIKFNASGASRVNTVVQATEIIAEVNGASKFTVGGKADKERISASGASKVDAEKLVAREVKVNASGASNVSCAPTEVLTSEASGASKVNFKKSPGLDKVKINDSGSGKTRAI